MATPGSWAATSHRALDAHTMSSALNVLVLGSGAIGTLLGTHLAQAGVRVTFIVRPAALDQLRMQGLTAQHKSYTIHIANPTLATDPQSVLEQQHFDCVVLAVKSYDTETAALQLQAAGRSLPPIVCMQNGVDNEALLAKFFGGGNVIAGTVTTAATQTAPGSVTVERIRGVGFTAGTTLATRLAAALQATEMRVQLYADARAMKWSKLLTNMLGNATSAICDITPGAVFAHPGLYRAEVEALRETLRVMRKLQIPVVNLPGVQVRLLAAAITLLPAAWYQNFLTRQVGHGRGGKMPSLHNDLFSGRTRSEVGWLNGAAQRHALACGLSAPVNAGLANILTDLVSGQRQKSDFRHKPDKLATELSRQ